MSCVGVGVGVGSSGGSSGGSGQTSSGVASCCHGVSRWHFYVKKRNWR